MNGTSELCSSSIVSIKQGSSELEHALFTGRVFHHGNWWIAVPREVVAAAPALHDPGSVIFELNRSSDLKKPSSWKVFLMAVRPSLWGLTLFPCLSVICYFYGEVVSGLPLGLKTQSWGFGVSALFGIVLLQIACQILGDIEDYRRLLDLPGTWGGSPVLRKGWMTVQQLKHVSLVALCLAVIVGLPALMQDVWLLCLSGALALLGGLVYVGRSFGLKYQKEGEYLLFFLLGPGLTLGFSWAAFHWMDLTITLIGLLFGGLSVCLSRIHRLQNLTPSVGTDGFRWVKLFLMFLYSTLGVGVVLCVYFKFFPSLILIGIVPAVFMAAGMMRQLHRVSGPASALLNGLRKDACILHGYVGFGLSLAFLMSRKLI